MTVIQCVPAEAIFPAGTETVICEPLSAVVVSGAPFHCTTAPEAKLLPNTVSVKAPPPTATLEDDRELIAGMEALFARMGNCAATDTPPPGSGLKTVIDPLPAVLTSLARIVACNCVLLM